MSRQGKARVTLYLDRRDLAVLGREPTSAGVSAALEQYAQVIEEAGYALDQRLTPAQWEYLRAALELRRACVEWREGNLRGLLGALCVLAKSDPTTADALEAVGGARGVDDLVAEVERFSRVEIYACFLGLAFGLGVLRAGATIDRWWSPWLRIESTLRVEADAEESAS